MTLRAVTLTGNLVRLEPLELHHADALVAASSGDAELYRWTPIPRDKASASQYIETALSWQAAGTAVAFVIVRLSNNKIIGSSRFWNIERWPWPPGHSEYGKPNPDACEIGYTWFSHDSIRTGTNTESKLLMLTHAFESWKVFRVCFHTDARNTRSQAAIERVGGKFEGILRSHRMAADYIPRNSARYSIVAAEWPEAKQRLQQLLSRS